MYECETCTASFWYEEDCYDHMDCERHWPECETCTRKFQTQRACDQHMNATNHWAQRFGCETCRKAFWSQAAADQHMTAIGHWQPKVCCETCPEKFCSQNAADQHMEDEGHYKNYCKICARKFQNENNLNMHLQSNAHRGTNIPCPFCKVGYTSATGVAHHLERGACPSAPQLNRETILRLVRQVDVDGAITNKQIAWREEEAIQYSATDRAFNGFRWECYLCHREFKLKKGLDQHLNSPAHREKVYRCPNAKNVCGKTFTTLAALFNHLESESCAFMRFHNVHQQMNKVFAQRTIGYAPY